MEGLPNSQRSFERGKDGACDGPSVSGPWNGHTMGICTSFIKPNVRPKKCRPKKMNIATELLILQTLSKFAGKITLYVALLYVCPLVKEFLSFTNAQGNLYASVL